MSSTRQAGQRLRALIGLRPSSADESHESLEGFDDTQRSLIEQVRPHTMTSPERIAGLVDAVQYVVRRELPGAFVECGVWRGGSVLAMVLTLSRLGVEDREVYLFDTFEGMTAPTDADTSQYDEPAVTTWERARRTGRQAWGSLFGPQQFGLEQVQELVASSGYPPSRLHFVAGPVEETVPDRAPSQVALLRLDTDWYESTRHELIHLYPRLGTGGVLIIDDYGHWEGCRRAVEEYFSTEAPPLLLSRLDYTGRMAVKL